MVIRMKITPEILEEATKLYLEGNSLQRVTQVICSRYNIKICRETLRQTFLKNRIERKKIKVKVCKDFTIVIPLSEINKRFISPNDYIKVVIEKNSKVADFYLKVPRKPKSRKSIEVRKNLPAEIKKNLNLKEGDFLIIKEIEKITHPTIIKSNEFFDLVEAIPTNVMCEEIIKNGEKYLKIWYASRNGRAKMIELKRFIPLSREVGEFFGLLQAEGSKKSKLSFTNNIIEEHKKVVNVAEKHLGILREKWQVCVYYNPKLLTKKKVEKIAKKFFSSLNLKSKKVGFVKHEGLGKVNFQIYISSKILSSIINNSLKILRKKATNSEEFCKGFILKVLIGDGTCSLNKKFKSMTIMISEADIEAQEDLIKMLKFFGIKARVTKNRIYLSTDFYSCLYFLENYVFETHEENRKKFMLYVANNYYFNLLYKRLKSMVNSITTARELATKNNLSIKTAEMYLLRNSKRGFIRKVGKGLYVLSEKGKKFIILYEKVLKEVLTLTNSQGN